MYTSFGGTKNRSFYGDPKAQERWIDEIIGLVEELDLDGVNVDVEALPIELVADYGAFVGRLRTALRERRPDAQVSVATQANEVGAAMAAAAAVAGADRIFLMAYDYRWAGSEPGASAPIDRIDGEVKDITWSLDLYGTLGVPADRLILGLPLYGVTWPVIAPGFLAPSSGRGDAWVPRRNLGVFADPSFEPTYEPTESVEFYTVPSAFATASAVGERLLLSGRARAPSRSPGTRSTTTLPGVLPRNFASPTSVVSPVPGSGRSGTSGVCPITPSSSPRSARASFRLDDRGPQRAPSGPGDARAAAPARTRRISVWSKRSSASRACRRRSPRRRTSGCGRGWLDSRRPTWTPRSRHGTSSRARSCG